MTLAVVAGGSGFLGAEIVRQALASGMDVRTANRRRGPALGGSHFVGDLRDETFLDGVMRSADIVVQAAGMAHVHSGQEALRADFWAGNVDVTGAVVRAAVRAGVRQVVLASSVSVYGSESGTRDESAEARPHGAYAESKLAAEAKAIEAVSGSSTGLSILRLATLYGAGDPGNVGRLIAALRRGWFLQVGKGDNRKSLLHVQDAASACVLAARTSQHGVSVFNVSAEPVKMREILRLAAEALTRRPRIVRVPASVGLTGAQLIRGIALRRFDPVATIAKWLSDELVPARRIAVEVGFVPKVLLEEGLREEVRWIESTVPAAG